MTFKNIFKQASKWGDKEISLVGRIKTNRQGKAISFLTINDGTTIKDIQVVYKDTIISYKEAANARVSSIVAVTGSILLTPGRPQPFEIQATMIKVLDQASEDYPLQKKEHSNEFLREISQLRARTKTFQCIMKIRSSASFAIHEFFNKKDFMYINTPIITGNDAEGAGESFIVTTRTDGKYESDFFAKKASLTVSGQLHAEAYAQAFQKVYTFGPTFRAENSYTTKHAAEFWMIEPEIAFCGLEENIILIEDMVKYIVKYILENCSEELLFCDENLESGLINKLKNITKNKFAIITYEEGIKILKDAITSGHTFEDNNVEYGIDLGTEHEKYICEVVKQKPTFVTNYPKEIKAFYMKQNNDGKTVAAVDLLVPGIGELVGGSQREDSYDKIIAKCNELNINIDDMAWYNDLRKYGYYKSAGFGMGFERLVMYLTGVSNIRDVIPFPRTPKNLIF